MEVVNRLFHLDNKNWYNIKAGRLSVRDYFEREYHTKFEAAYDRLHNALGAIGERFRQEGRGDDFGFREAGLGRSGYVEVGKTRILIPDMSFRGKGPVGQPRDLCLVHGDMHGGNVLVERGGVGGSDLVARDTRVKVLSYRLSKRWAGSASNRCNCVGSVSQVG